MTARVGATQYGVLVLCSVSLSGVDAGVSFLFFLGGGPCFLGAFMGTWFQPPPPQFFLDSTTNFGHGNKAGKLGLERIVPRLTWKPRKPNLCRGNSCWAPEPFLGVPCQFGEYLFGPLGLVLHPNAFSVKSCRSSIMSLVKGKYYDGTKYIILS